MIGDQTDGEPSVVVSPSMDDGVLLVRGREPPKWEHEGRAPAIDHVLYRPPETLTPQETLRAARDHALNEASRRRAEAARLEARALKLIAEAEAISGNVAAMLAAIETLDRAAAGT